MFITPETIFGGRTTTIDLIFCVNFFQVYNAKSSGQNMHLGDFEGNIRNPVQ
jgi:hypothetical protein